MMAQRSVGCHWVLSVVLAAAWLIGSSERALAQGGPQRPAPSGGVGAALPNTATIDRVQSVFAPTQGWFRLVADATFRVGADGRFTPDFQSLRNPRVRRADNAGHTIVPSYAGRFDLATRIASGEDRDIWLELIPVGARPVAPHQEGGLLVYRDGFVDTDVIEKSTPTHADEYLFLRTRSAPTEWRYVLTHGPAVDRVRQVGNVLEAVDANGVARIRSSRPFAIDASGRRLEGTVRVEGNEIIIGVSTTTLQYPVLVDPDWRSTGDMSIGRFYFGANELPNGRILATGGCASSTCSGDLTLPNCPLVVRAAETLDLGTRTWTAVGDDSEGRIFHSAVSLANGSVLLAGGCPVTGCTTVSATVRLFDPVTGAFGVLPNLAEPRAGMIGLRLPSGRVLLAGGCDTTHCTTRTEIYDPTTRSFTPGGPMTVARGRAEVLALADGRVLAIGGCTNLACGTVLASAEVYDPVSDRWTATSPMATARAGHHATLLLSGRVLVGGGCSEPRCSAVLRSTELFDPVMARFSPGPDQLSPRLGARGVRLPDGTVMVNQGCQTREMCDLSNERFDPRTMVFTNMEPAVTSRGFQETLLHARSRLVVAIGGCQPGTCSWWNETYDISAIPAAPGTDAGRPDASPSDASAVDGGPRDARADVAFTDNGVLADIGAPVRPQPTCGCRSVGRGGSGSWVFAALLYGLLFPILWRRSGGAPAAHAKHHCQHEEGF